MSKARLPLVLLNGDQIFPAILEAIASARTTITFETFIYWSGEVREWQRRPPAAKLLERAASLLGAQL